MMGHQKFSAPNTKLMQVGKKKRKAKSAKAKAKAKEKKRHKAHSRGKRQKIEEEEPGYVPDIPCPWKTYGCPITLPLSDLSSHLNKYLAEHLAIVDRAFERQREQLTPRNPTLVSPPLKPSVPDPPGSGNGSSGSRILVKNEGLDLELSRTSTASSAPSTDTKELKVKEEQKEPETILTPAPVHPAPKPPRFTIRILTAITDAIISNAIMSNATLSTPDEERYHVEPFESPYNSTSFIMAQRGRSPFWSGPPEPRVPGMATPVNELFTANSAHSFDQYGTHTAADPEQLYGEFMDSPIRPDDERSSPSSNHTLSPLGSTSPRSSHDPLSPRDTLSPASTPKTPIAAAPLGLTSSDTPLEQSSRTDTSIPVTNSTTDTSIPGTNSTDTSIPGTNSTTVQAVT